MKSVNEIVASLQASARQAQHPGSVYFLGIGGIGMSALARYFHSIGVQVSGYDKTATTLSRQLMQEGIEIHYEDNLQLLDKQAQLVVFTPAIPAAHAELNYYLQNNYPVVKRSDVLGAITSNGFSIAVAGTHGKTTTSSMIAHILRHSEYGCNAFLGGIAVNYNTNFWSSSNDVSVAEADEYDRSFLKLNPDIAIISSMDADHLDIYGTPENMEQAFIDFAARIKPGGLLISRYGLKRAADLIAPTHLTYDVENAAADISALNIQVQNGSYCFDVKVQQQIIQNVLLNMGGRHNIENATAAIAVAVTLGIDAAKIKAAVQSFSGVKRRFEYIIKSDEQVFVDDYAHHPEELRALITGAKGLYPSKKCTVIFQPHLFSRTKDHADGFAQVLDMADEVVLLPIYPARELPMPGVSSQLIASRMANKNVQIIPKEALPGYVKNHQPQLLITAGAGDIDTMLEAIKNSISTQQ
jgi:UDP-N-acetylmuramate--alanine ligase